MIFFTSLSPVCRYALGAILFFETVFQLTLCLYQYGMSENWKKSRKNFFLFLGFMLLLTYLSTSFGKENILYQVPIPWGILILIIAGSFLYTARAFIREYRAEKERVSPASIREALNHLDTGVCFADDSGRILLINQTMSDLISSLSGNEPRILPEILEFLEAWPDYENIASNGHFQRLYYFPDGNIWQIYTEELSRPDLRGFTQTIAHNVTELYETNRNILAENEKLKETNQKLESMYEHLADRIREQETLHLKMQIHNDIGTSLIAISHMMNEKPNPENEPNCLYETEQSHITKKHLKQLQNAVSYFSNNRFDRQKSWQRVVNRAKEMNVTCVLDGFLPNDSSFCELLADAVGECATNCVRHAGGDRIFIQITEQNCHYTFTITNNGNTPKAIGKEGTGLSSLRKKIEQRGGTMKLSREPEFALTVLLPVNISNNEK